MKSTLTNVSVLSHPQIKAICSVTEEQNKETLEKIQVVCTNINTHTQNIQQG